MHCYHCKKDIPLTEGEKVTRREQCPHCNGDIHCCKMCKYYDKGSYNECREPNAERIVEKNQGNFCDYFSLLGNTEIDNKDELLEKAAKLFKD